MARAPVAAQAEVPQGWHWDGIMRRPFSMNEAVEIFDGMGYQACTYIVDGSRDPFGALVAGKTPEGRPMRWLARGFAARYNFNSDKIIMEYREPLPAGIESLQPCPWGPRTCSKVLNSGRGRYSAWDQRPPTVPRCARGTRKGCSGSTWMRVFWVPYPNMTFSTIINVTMNG